jgi:hypothetical protein
LTRWFTRKKNGHLYRYYLAVRDNKERAGISGLPRLPVAELEAAVLEQMRRVLRALEMVAGVICCSIELNEREGQGANTYKYLRRCTRMLRQRDLWYHRRPTVGIDCGKLVIATSNRRTAVQGMISTHR